MNQEMQLSSAPLSGTDAIDTAYITNSTGGKVRIKSIKILPKTAVATHASNYITTTVKKGVGGTTIASHTTNSTGGSALAVGTPTADLTSGTGTNLELAADGVLAIDVAKAGTGPAYNHQVVALVEPIRT